MAPQPRAGPDAKHTMVVCLLRSAPGFCVIVARTGREDPNDCSTAAFKTHRELASTPQNAPARRRAPFSADIACGSPDGQLRRRERRCWIDLHVSKRAPEDRPILGK